jgi:Flp pilus assembly protein TadG
VLRDERGSTAVELALVLPVFIAFVVGFFEFCWTQHCEASIRTALDQASRAVVLNPSMTQASIQSMVRSELTALADPNVTVTESIQNTTYGRLATLTASYPHTLGVPGMLNYSFTYTTTVKAPLPTF